MHTILIPTDFSANALHAISYALNLYKCERCEFYFLHANSEEEVDRLSTSSTKTLKQIKNSASKTSLGKLNELIKEIKQSISNPRHNYHAISTFELLVDALNDVVNTKNIDLVIMGTKGQTSSTKLAYGSNTVQVFKYVQCPVLAIPVDAEFHPPKRIAFPTDFMIPYKRRELKLLNSLGMGYKSQIHCLYISEFEDLSLRQQDNKLFLTNSLRDSYLFFNTVAGKNKAKVIKEFIENNKIDFLVMVNSRHSFLEDLLYRSTIDKIGLTTKIPFLVMQNLSREPITTL